MPIIPSSSATVTEDKDKVTAIPFDVTLTTANTSQTLFTVPAGQKLRAFSITNNGPGKAHFAAAPGVPATTTHGALDKANDVWFEEDLDLADGTYAFINGGASNKPRLSGVAWTGPA